MTQALFSLRCTAQKWSFPLRISSVNVTKSALSCGFSHIYWRSPLRKTSVFKCSDRNNQFMIVLTISSFKKSDERIFDVSKTHMLLCILLKNNLIGGGIIFAWQFLCLPQLGKIWKPYHFEHSSCTFKIIYF